MLEAWRITVRQVGKGWARKGLTDEDLIVGLQNLRHPTLFTRDSGFYDRELCHRRYCLVVIAAGQYEVAGFIRRFLRHRSFDTQAKRMGKVIRVSPSTIALWSIHGVTEISATWVSR